MIWPLLLIVRSTRYVSTKGGAIAAASASMSNPLADRPLWWTRQDISSYKLSNEEAWNLINNPPWKCVVAWVTKDFQPVACEMAYAILDGQIVLTSTSDRDKVKALRRNPAISVCISRPGLRQITVRGRVEISDDRGRVRQWAEAAADQLGISGIARRREIERYLSPNRVTLTVIVEQIRSFDGRKMLRDERECDDERTGVEEG
jgi:hypothetical protein